MHIAPEFRPAQRGWEARLIRGNPVATFISAGTPDIEVSHLPMVLDGAVDGAGEGELQGRTLIGHMPRAGRQWPVLLRDPIATAVFHGPAGYVSATAHGAGPAVPSWNHTAVHVRGRVRLLHEADDVLRVLMETITVCESDREEPWDPAPSMDRVHALLPQVIGFSMRITAVESVARLSQDRPAEQRERIRADLGSSPRGGDRDLAALMAEEEAGAQAYAASGG